jgi:hypothetical protein
MKKNGMKAAAQCHMVTDLCTRECGILEPHRKYVSLHGDLRRKAWLLRGIGNRGNCVIQPFAKSVEWRMRWAFMPWSDVQKPLRFGRK